MLSAPRIDVEELIADLEPGETVEYMGQIWGSSRLADHSPQATKDPEEAEAAATAPG